MLPTSWLSPSNEIETRLSFERRKDRYRTLVETLPAITYIAELGASGPWHYVSPQIESILGFSPAEWLSDR